MNIPFNEPLQFGNELQYISDTIKRGKFSAFGKYTRLCSEQLINLYEGCRKVHMTSSCTAAMEMAVSLTDISCGDEVIMPSFTHVGTANPFLRAGANIVWCDIEASTMNLNSKKLEELITSDTKAIVVVHYAGIACCIDEIEFICNKYNILLIEDCAMALGATFKKQALGTFGDLAVTSFHETKNIHCGEGGALIINNNKFIDKADILINCGTDKRKLDLGKTDHYSWIAKSSNFKMSELQAAFLYAQLENLQTINNKRMNSWNSYYQLLQQILPLQNLPCMPRNTQHNGHLFYIHTNSKTERDELIEYLRKHSIQAVFHYIPLHNAPIWNNSSQNKSPSFLPVTESKSKTLLRLPLFYNLNIGEIVYIAEKISEFYSSNRKE